MSPDGITAEWKDASQDPDPISDLGYEFIDLEVLQTEDGSGRLMIIPCKEDMIADDAFIVASASSVCDLDEQV